jgi:hypothetical protein
MGQIYTFHKSVMGQSHVDRNIPCEDASGSFSAEDGSFHIAVVSDGHGQKKSFRSNVGSQIAVDVTMECLRGLAEDVLENPETAHAFQQDLLHNPRFRQTTVRRLTDSILAGWSDRIHEDFYMNPPAQEEIGEYADYFRDENRLPQIYGATLMAALWLPDCVILLHQGDGRCDVFYTDGTADQPIPWDERCQGNQTTSLCDEDAADSFRSRILDLQERPVAACYLGSDGVEDAYRSDEGTHTFYRVLSCKRMELGQEAFMEYLQELLPKFSAWGMFSKVGSRDDVSVACIADEDALRPLVPGMQTKIRQFELGEALFWEEDALRSKSRAHGILQRRLDEAVDKLERSKAQLEQLRRQQEKILSRQENLQNEIFQTEMTMEEEQRDFEDFQGYLQSDAEPEDVESAKILRYLKKYPQAMREMMQNLMSIFTSRQEKRDRLKREDQVLASQVQQMTPALVQAEAEVAQLQEQADQARAAFDEFDSKYQEIAGRIEALREQIAQLDEVEYDPELDITQTDA